jgi:hypothetical protein
MKFFVFISILHLTKFVLSVYCIPDVLIILLS